MKFDTSLMFVICFIILAAIVKVPAVGLVLVCSSLYLHPLLVTLLMKSTVWAIASESRAVSWTLNSPAVFGGKFYGVV